MNGELGRTWKRAPVQNLTRRRSELLCSCWESNPRCAARSHHRTKIFRLLSLSGRLVAVYTDG